MLTKIINNKDLLACLVKFLKLVSIKKLTLCNISFSKKVKIAMLHRYRLNIDKIHDLNEIGEIHKEYTRNIRLIKSYNINCFKNLKNVLLMKDVKIDFPDTLTVLLISEYTHEIKTFPPNLRVLCLGRNYNYKILPNMLPKTLREITINSGYTHDLKDVLPQSVTSLTFAYGYTRKPPDKLPPILESLSLPFIYRHKIPELPETLNTLMLPTDYKYSLPKTLNLKSLTMNRYCKRLKIGDLPINLEYLNLKGYNYELNVGVLPKTLKTLRIEWRDIKNPNTVLPKNLQHLTIYYRLNNLKSNMLPNNIDHMYLRTKRDDIVKSEYFPSDIKSLSITGTGTIISLPQNLESLKWGIRDQDLTGVLPSKLKNLYMNYYETVITNDMLPASLETITLYRNCHLDKNIRSSIKIIVLTFG